MPGTGWYDRQGKLLSLEVAGRLLEDTDYKRVASTILPDGKRVLTVWRGLNHNGGTGPPLIFETTVFLSESDLGELAGARYATLTEAKQGHEAMVAQFSGGAAKLKREAKKVRQLLHPAKRRHLESYE